jgi:hypothetical protein
MSELSPLARAYLENLEVIEAGWAALRADMPRALEALAARRRRLGEQVVAHPEHLERSWPEVGAGLQQGVALTLRLWWSSRQPLRPWLTLNQSPQQTREVPGAMRHIFPEPLWALWSAQLGEPDAEALLRDPEAELERLWHQGCQAVGALARGPALRERLTGFALLSEVSSQLHAHSQELARHSATPAQRPGEVAAEEGWPAYVQVDWVAASSPQAWELVYTPQEEGGALWLVLYDGVSLGLPLPVAVPDRYQGRFPVMADWSQELAQLVAVEDLAQRRREVLRVGAALARGWVQKLEQVQALWSARAQREVTDPS